VEAKTGDWLVIKGRTNGQHEQRGLITDVRSRDGAPPYVVRWMQTGGEALVFPGPDAVIVTASDQSAADAKARDRFASVQAEINHPGAPAESRAAAHSHTDLA
jgi:hypothetical protein